MKREELCERLRAPYSEKTGCGIEKVPDAPEYANVWFVVPPAPPRTAPAALPLAALSKANAVLSRLPTFEEMSEIDKTVNYFFVRREAVQSSRMEGTWSTLDNVLTPPQIYDAGEGKSGQNSVRGYALSLEAHCTNAYELKEKVFTESLVRQIHRDIMAKEPRFTGVPGALREPGGRGAVVQIGGLNRREESIYNPAPPRHVKASLGKVVEWLSDEELAQAGDAGMVGLTLPVRLAIAHAHFEAVHPFSDGNGRVGRALWPLQMVCSHRMPLYLSGYVEEEKKEYGDALQQAQKKLNYAPLIEFLCEAISQSDAESRATTLAILNLPQRWKERAKFRAKSTSARALDLLLHKPIVTVALLEAELGVSKQAANEAIHQLVERKIMRQREKSGRSQLYVAEELVALLSRRFGASVDEALADGYAVIEQGRGEGRD